MSQEHLQPIRFQGQSFDTETGLHYNRFRYFDPDMGMFTTRDPIGLAGGSNVFQYAPNPVGWIDPFGLSAYTDVDLTPLPESGHLYRGIHAKHPALPDAKKGIARPARESGGASATEHNAGGTSSNSTFTSWTDDIDIARSHANKEGPGGVILSAPYGAPKAGEKWNFEISDDVYFERERLINGTRSGLGVHKS